MCIDIAKRSVVRVVDVNYMPWTLRTVEDLPIGGEAWVSLDGEHALPVRVVGKDDRDYDVRFECFYRHFISPGPLHYFRHDEVRSTPTLACINTVTL